MQASWRKSLRVDSISRFTGFDEYYGAEDMWCNGPEKGHPLLGTWDRCMYEFILKKLKEAKEPFFLFAFSAATHIPFYSPGKKWEKFPHSNGTVLGFLNTLYYADWAIEKFMESARKEKWFKNTIFFFVADHTFLLNDKPLHKFGIHPHRRPLEFLRIPLIIYAPGLLYPREVTDIYSQVDIYSTILDLIHEKGKFSAISNSIFDKSPRYAINLNGYYYTIVSNDGYLKFDTKNILGKSGNYKKLLNEIEAYHQIMFNLIYSNKLFP